jgi:hypothetical protein
MCRSSVSVVFCWCEGDFPTAIGMGCSFVRFARLYVHVGGYFSEFLPITYFRNSYRISEHYAVDEDRAGAHPYSDRNTVTGSIRTARIIGGRAANNAAVRIANEGRASEPRSTAFT